MTVARSEFQLAANTFLADQSATDAAGYVASVEMELDKFADTLLAMALNAKDLHYAKGDLAEGFHAGTFNVDAARSHLGIRAEMPRDTSVNDIIFPGTDHSAAQLKYYRTAQDSTTAVSHPHYDGMAKVVPADQLDEVRLIAERLAAKNAETRPQMEHSYGHTADSVSDRLSAGGASSKPLTEAESRALVQEIRDNGSANLEALGLTAAKQITLMDIMAEAGNAAGQAAAMSAAVHLTPAVVTALRQITGFAETDLDALQELVGKVPEAALRSGLAGGLTAAIVTGAKAGILGARIENVDPPVVAAAVVLAINALQNSVKAATGEISWREARRVIVEDSLVIVAALAGAAAGQSLLPIPILGALIGNFAGAITARLAIAHANRVVLALSVNRGWTTFGVVDQDYVVPAPQLRAAHWELFDPDPLPMDVFDADRFGGDPFDNDFATISGARIVRRGVVSFNRVAYI